MLSSIEILILSFIQGVTEFLPISSAAHLVIISKYYVFDNQNLLIDICLHFGSLIAITVYFRNDLFDFNNNKKFLIKIIIATLPIIPIGYWSSHNFSLNSWDSFLITLPFSKLSFVWGDAINIPKNLKNNEISKFQNILENKINECITRAKNNLK